MGIAVCSICRPSFEKCGPRDASLRPMCHTYCGQPELLLLSACRQRTRNRIGIQHHFWRWLPMCFGICTAAFAVPHSGQSSGHAGWIVCNLQMCHSFAMRVAFWKHSSDFSRQDIFECAKCAHACLARLKPYKLWTTCAMHDCAN